jgi:hemolysin III
MFVRPREPAIYSRAEIVSDAAVHAVGLVAALVGVAVLLVLAGLWFGATWVLLAAAVYGTTLVGMFVCSALYNLYAPPAWRDTFRRVDQSAIYMKIAGSYTPFAVLTGTHMGYFLAGVWSAAVAGASLILFGSERMRRPALLLYLAIGWAGLFAGRPLVAELSPAGFSLILAAGLVYTAGVVFYLWERLPFHNTIWHVFVLTASFVLYAAVVVELWQRAPGVIG